MEEWDLKIDLGLGLEFNNRVESQNFYIYLNFRWNRLKGIIQLLF